MTTMTTELSTELAARAESAGLLRVSNAPMPDHWTMAGEIVAWRNSGGSWSSADARRHRVSESTVLQHVLDSGAPNMSNLQKLIWAMATGSL